MQLKPALNPIEPKCGDLMTLAEFADCVKSTLFIDYDGFGELATATEVSDITVQPSKFSSMSIPLWATHVLWHNR